MRAFAYARFSTDRQSETSITDQLRVCREHAAARGWALAAEFADEAISGAALGNRPAAQRALAELAAGDVLLFMDLSRLSRSFDLAPLLERLRHRGVRVIGVQDGYDSTAEHADMQAGLSAIMSTEFRRAISKKTHAGLKGRALAGKATGSRAYGYTPAGEPQEPEAGVVREIFQRAAAGESLRAISNDLNARGVPSPGAGWTRATRTGLGRWQSSALHELLGNERYVGRVVWNRSQWVKDPDTGARKRRERPKSEWIVREGPALVDEATWETVQRLRAGRKVFGGGRGPQPRYLLSGILRCAECGAPMVVTGLGGSHYYCATRRQSGASACGMAVGVRREIAELLLLERVERTMLSDEAVAHALERLRKLRRQKRHQAAQEDSPETRALRAEVEEMREIVAARPGLASLRGALADAEDRLAAAVRRGWRAAAGGPDDVTLERAYRDTAQRMKETLRGRDVQARLLLQAILQPIPCRPEPGGQYLVAEVVGVSPVPLWQAAGLSRNGSGGRLPTEAVSLRAA